MATHRLSHILGEFGGDEDEGRHKSSPTLSSNKNRSVSPCVFLGFHGLCVFLEPSLLENGTHKINNNNSYNFFGALDNASPTPIRNNTESRVVIFVLAYIGYKFITFY